MKKKVKRYNEGGKTEEQYKKEGLAASNKEDRVGFFERLRMGNIDSPGSEAYYKFGAGRGRMEEESRTKVPESANKSSDYSGRGSRSSEPVQTRGLGMSGTDRGGDDGMNVPHSGTPTGKRDSSVEDSSTSVSKGVMSNYMPSGVYKQPEPRAGETKIRTQSTPKKAPAPAPKKQTTTNVPTGMAGSKSKKDGEPTSERFKAVSKAIEGTASNLFRSIDPEAIRKERLRTIEERRKREKAERLGYGMKKGGKVSSASSRADGIAQRGKTRGKLF